MVTEVNNLNNDQPIVKYIYDDKGKRLKKESYVNGTLQKTTFYVRDAAGNPMAIYEQEIGSALSLQEQPIYGSSRIGTYKPQDQSNLYQLTDHLGNVRAVIAEQNGSALALIAHTDYYPFGMPMPNRNVVGDYRYKFQGQELDPETGKEAFQLRLWDSRIGRWLTVDPVKQYISPYLGMGNDPINGIDFDGRKFKRGTGVNIQQFNAWKTRMKGLLATGVFDYLENHPVPITVNFLTTAPRPGLDGETTTTYSNLNKGFNYALRKLNTMTLPIENSNNNNIYVNTATTSFTKTDTRIGSDGRIAPRVTELSFDQLVDDLCSQNITASSLVSFVS